MDLTSFSDALLLGPMPNTNLTFMETVIMPGLPLVADELKTWPDNELVVEKYEKTLSKFLPQIKNVFGGKNDKIYSVLNHSDFHFKNIMVKHTPEGKLNDLLLVCINYLLVVSDRYLTKEIVV